MPPQQFAVNLVSLLGLTREPKYLPLYLLLKGIVTETVIQPEKHRPAHDALLVSSDITQERWEAIVKIVRLKFRYNELPLYQKEKSGWRKM